MKKTILIFIMVVSLGSSAQEKITITNWAYVSLPIWDIPLGVDTTKQKGVFDYFDANDSVSVNYYKNNDRIDAFQISDTMWTYFDKKRKHRWVMYENGSSQLQQPRIIKTIVLKLPTPSEKIRIKIRDKIIEHKNKTPEEKHKIIDSVFYNKRVKIKPDSLLTPKLNTK